MGSVQKQVMKRMREKDELKDKLISDLLWYVEAMNDLIDGFVKDANNLNEAATKIIKDKKGALE